MPIIYNIKDAVYREKMVGIDYDWTLVNPKEAQTFPKDISDWKWYYPNVKEKVKQFYDDGYMIVIFTNQSKSWKCEQIKIVAEELGIPLFVVIAMNRKEYKPSTLMFFSLFSDSLFSDTILNKDYKINKDESFYIGDAIGRKIDFSDSDKVFAQNIGIKCITPESIFHVHEEIIVDDIILSDNPEIIIMVGYPASGKSTIAKEICKNDKYIHIEGDIYKTSPKMIKASLPYILESKSIVFDATNSSIKKRLTYINLAKKNNMDVRCVYMSTSLDISLKNNRLREEDSQIPKIAYSVYNKHFETPTMEEDFKFLNIV